MSDIQSELEVAAGDDMVMVMTMTYLFALAELDVVLHHLAVVEFVGEVSTGVALTTVVARVVEVETVAQFVLLRQVQHVRLRGQTV